MTSPFVPPQIELNSFLKDRILSERTYIVDQLADSHDSPLDPHVPNFVSFISYGGSLKKLNNSVKSNTSYVRKVKAFQDSLSNQQKASLVSELKALNCRRYLDEIVDGLLCIDKSKKDASSLKELPQNDIAILLSLAVILFMRYESFSSQFLDKIMYKSSHLHHRDKVKILLSLHLIGIGGPATEEHGAIERAYMVLKDKIEKESSKGNEVLETISTLSMVIENFHCFLFASESSGSEGDSQIDPHKIVPSSVKDKFVSLYTSYLKKLFKRLSTGAQKLKEKQQSLHNKSNNQSGFSSETEFEKEMESYSKARRSWLKFYYLTEGIATYTNAIEIPSDIEGTATEMMQILKNIQEARKAEEEADRNREEFDDDYTRSFYRSLPDVKELLSSSQDASNQMDFNTLMNDLSKIYGRASFEQWVRDFAPFNTKKNRKVVAQAMYQVKRTSLEMLPHYSRLVKIFYPEYPDMAQWLTTQLLDEFERLFKEKDQIKVESKVKNIRFIGELTKFLLIPVNTTLNLLDRCLSDFTHHNINVACTLLETCGRFLLLHHESRKKMQGYIAQLIRMRDIMSFDDVYELMIENAIYTVKTEGTTNYSGAERVKLPPVHRYVLHLLYNQLNKKNCTNIIKKLLKLDWEKEETSAMLIDVFQDVRMARYDNIHLIACIVSGLAKYYPDFATVVIDRLIEDMRASLAGEVEISNQRRILDVKFFGELFVYQCFEYQLVIDILYMFIRYAPNTDDANDTMRIRLVCTLLDTCQKSFQSVPSKKQRSRYIIYLQDYVLRKGVRLPVDVEFMLSDTLDAINKNLRWPKNKEESGRRIAQLEKKSPIPMPSEDRLFPITKNPVTSEAYDFDEDEFNQLMNFEEEKEKKIEQQVTAERKLQDIKFERELQQMVQQDATERRMQRKKLQIESVSDIKDKLKTEKQKPTISFGSKKMVVMRRKKP